MIGNVYLAGHDIILTVIGMDLVDGSVDKRRMWTYLILVIIFIFSSVVAWSGILVSIIASWVLLWIGIIKDVNWMDTRRLGLVQMVVFLSFLSIFVAHSPSLRQWVAFVTAVLWLDGTFWIMLNRV